MNVRTTFAGTFSVCPSLASHTPKRSSATIGVSWSGKARNAESRPASARMRASQHGAARAAIRSYARLSSQAFQDSLHTGVNGLLV